MSTIGIYILSVHPLIINESLVWDVYYLTESSKDLNCLRIFNIYLSFLVARLPGLRTDQFIELMKGYTGELHTELRKDLIEAAYFSLGVNWEYLEIFAQSPIELRKIYQTAFRDFKYVYQNVNPKKLPPFDYLFYENTETPFRYTSSTLNINTVVYNLSTKYNIPLVGGAVLDTSRLTQDFPQDYLPNGIKPTNIHGLNAQLLDKELIKEFKEMNVEYNKAVEYELSLSKEEQMYRIITNQPLVNPNTYNSGLKTLWNFYNVNGNINKALIRDDTVDYKCNMTMLSYDIETYNEDGNLDPEIEDNYIFAIGIGIFNLTDQKPQKRFCIISKDFDTLTPYSPLLKKNLVAEEGSKHFNAKTIIVKNEYVEGDELDYTEYIIAKNEEHLLRLFINLIDEFKPQIINGFNSFAFDDNYVYVRMKRFGLEKRYLKVFTYYDVDEIGNQSWFKPFIPTFKQFELKIDGEQRADNASVRSPLVLTVDVRKLMLKEDPKRFTAHGRGNLDTMLDVYGGISPFTKAPLSKTGLKIHEMYAKWLANRDIYEIGLYCCQDAWICGTLLIKRSKIADLIELAKVSNTTFSDSIYRADGNRVINSVLGYAYRENFALMDTPFEFRTEIEHKEEGYIQYGGKKFDTRTILGGAVRCVHAGRHFGITAADYASAYPAGKEGNNIDSSTRVIKYIIDHPDLFGIKVVDKKIVNEPTGQREVYLIKIVDYDLFIKATGMKEVIDKKQKVVAADYSQALDPAHGEYKFNNVGELIEKKVVVTGKNPNRKEGEPLSKDQTLAMSLEDDMMQAAVMKELNNSE